MTRRAMTTSVRPHVFQLDPDVPADWKGRRWCRRCTHPGEQGDERHNVVDLTDDYREHDARRLGERVA